MFKYIALFLIFLICSYIGFSYGENFRDRSFNLKEFQKAVMLMNNEIIYSNTPLPQLFNNVSLKIQGVFSNIFYEISEDLSEGKADSVYDIFSLVYPKYESNIKFKPEDYNILVDFFKSLGETGIWGQEKIFKLTSDELMKNYTEAESEAKTNIKMYRTLGICAGALIVIFFI